MKDFKKKSFIIFDLDGVLFDSKKICKLHGKKLQKNLV